MVKGTRLLEYNNTDIGMLYRTKECLIKHFTFCYNNACQVYKDAKYGVSYWPQELELRGLKGTIELNKE